MTKNFLRILAALLALFTSSAHSLEFEDIVAGARVGALGGSYASLAEGYSSLFLNPAGLALIDSEGVTAGLGHYYAVPISNFHAGYFRPVYQGIGAAAAWQSTRSPLRQLDRFYFSWSQTADFPWLIGQKKQFAWGTSFRALSLRKRQRAGELFDSKIGAGLDLGTLLSLPESGTQIGASMTGLDSANLDLLGPFFTLGAAQKYKKIRILLDYRMRQGLSTFYPAVEAELYGGLLMLRAGRGIRLGELETVAFGAGFNLLPLTIDFGMHLPPEGLHRREGAAMVSVSYAFEGPRFYQKFAGVAAEEAQNLAREINALEERKRKSRAEAFALDRDLGVLREEATAIRSKIREEAAQAEIRKADSERKKEEQDERSRPKAPKEEWPKYRKVKPGDTLRSIASQAYGDPNLWELIYKANTEKIIRGLPKAGEVLTIPKP